MVGLGETISREGIGSPETAKDVLRMVSPYIVSAGEAYAEAKRGGVFTPGGQLIARQNPVQLAARAVGMRAPIKKYYFNARSKIMAAYESGRPEMVPAMVAEARKEGIFITTPMLNRMKGQVKSKERTVDEPADIFFPRK
jgi:hypothetical protein